MVEIVLLRMRVASGWPRRFVQILVRVLLAEQFIMRRGGVVGDAFRRLVNERLEPVLAEEAMYTESIFLDRRDGDLSLLWYMEAESMEAAYEGFVSSDHAVTDVAGRVAGWLFEDPERILSPNASSDYPLLAHAWHPDRP